MRGSANPKKSVNPINVLGGVGGAIGLKGKQRKNEFDNESHN